MLNNSLSIYLQNPVQLPHNLDFITNVGKHNEAKGFIKRVAPKGQVMRITIYEISIPIPFPLIRKLNVNIDITSGPTSTSNIQRRYEMFIPSSLLARLILSSSQAYEHHLNKEHSEH